MNYLIGFTLFMVGAVVAYIAEGRAAAAWIIVAGVAALWGIVGLYALGVHHGKRNNDL